MIADRAAQPCAEQEAINRERGHFPPYGRLVEVEAPVLIMQGLERVQSEDGPLLVRVVRHAEVVLVRGAGHDPWAAQPDAFFSRVLEFVGGLR